jgi:hypothetical protein
MNAYAPYCRVAYKTFQPAHAASATRFTEIS